MNLVLPPRKYRFLGGRTLPHHGKYISAWHFFSKDSRAIYLSDHILGKE